MMLHLEKTLLHLRKKGQKKDSICGGGWMMLHLEEDFCRQSCARDKGSFHHRWQPTTHCPHSFSQKKMRKMRDKNRRGKVKAEGIVWKYLKDPNERFFLSHVVVHNTPRHTFSLKKKKKIVLHLRYKYENSWKLHKKGLISITGDRLHRHCTIG